MKEEEKQLHLLPRVSHKVLSLFMTSCTPPLTTTTMAVGMQALPDAGTGAGGIEDAVTSALHQHLPMFQQAIYYGQFPHGTRPLDYIMSMPGVLKMIAKYVYIQQYTRSFWVMVRVMVRVRVENDRQVRMN